MDVQTVLAVVDLQVQRTVADDAAGVPLGLADLGWTADPVAREGVIDQVWNHRNCAGMCCAQTGFKQENFYIGLIANFIDDDPTEAGVFHGQIHDLIHPQLLDAGFTLTGPHDSSLLWSDGHTAVDLSLLRRIHQRTHTVPSAVQFAIYPLQHVSQPGPGPDGAEPRAASAGSTGFA